MQTYFTNSTCYDNGRPSSGAGCNTLDGGYALTGGVNSNLFLVKTNSQGDTIWTKQYPKHGQGFGIEQTMDGGFIIGATTVDTSLFIGQDIYSEVIRTNNLGDTIWTKQISSDTTRVTLNDFTIINDGILFTGNYVWKDNTSNWRKDIIILKTDTLGNELWRKIYGKNNYACSYCDHETSYAIISDLNGHSYVSGSRDFYTTSGTYESSGWLLKINQLGDTIWTRQFGGEGALYGLKLLNDGNIVAVGESQSFGSGVSSIFITKINSGGSEMWFNTISDYAMFGFSVDTTYDGGYIILGETEKPPYYETNAILIKTDNSGNVVWEHEYGLDYESDKGYGLIYSTLNEIIFWGNTKSFGTSGTRELWLVKTDSNGIVSTNRIEEDTDIILFPNPANSIVTLNLAHHSNGKIIITDILGREVLSKSFTSNEVQLYLKSLESKGTYFAKVLDSDGNVIAIKKLIYQ